MGIGRTSARQSSAFATSSATATPASVRSSTTPLLDTAGESQPDRPPASAARSLALRLFSLVAVLSILPAVLVAFVESSNRHAREQLMLALLGHSVAIARTFTALTPTDPPKVPVRSAQL